VDSLKLFIYCAGGIGREIYDIAYKINMAENTWDEISFIDDTISSGEVYGAFQCTYEQFKAKYHKSEVQVVVGNGEPKVREILFNKLIKDGYYITSVIDKTSCISRTAKIGQGSIIYPYTYISSDAVIDENCLVIAGSCIGHDTVVSKHSVISTLVSISGNCFIGNNVYIGTKAVIKEKVRIGSYSIIGMGSCVFKDIPDEVIALGNPAREIKRNDNKKVF